MKLIDNGLKLRKLGEVCTYSKGKKPAVLKETKTLDCSVPYINIKAFEKGIISEYTNGEKCNICNDDDLLMVWDGARCGLIGKAKKGAVGSTLMKILPKENIHKEYLYHFISSKFWTLNTKPKGVGIPHIEPTLLWNFELVVPPLPEQQAIVAKIEALLSELENGKQQLQTAQQQLKVYKQSLLKWAFEGKLTNKNVKDGELPKGWKWVRLGDILESVKNGYGKKPDDNGEKKILRISSVRPNSVDFSDVRYLKNNLSIEYEVLENDLLFTRYNGSKDYVGVCGRVPNLAEKLFYPDKLIRCRPKIKEHYHSKYLQYASNCGASRKFILSKLKTTAGQTGIAGGEIKQIPIPLAPIEEQQLIVSELESKLTVCDKIEETISQSLQQAETLRQSILKKAFEGKLVTNLKK